MLDIGWSELLVVAIVAIVVVGPKELPKLMRTFGFYAGKIKRAAGDFRRQFDEAMAESEAEEVRKNIEAIRANMGTAADFNRPIDQPLMTSTDGPPPNALGEPIVQKEPQEASKLSAPAKRAPVKRAPQAKKKAAKKTAAKKGGATPKPAAKRPRKTKTAARPQTSAKGKGPAEPKS